MNNTSKIDLYLLFTVELNNLCFTDFSEKTSPQEWTTFHSQQKTQTQGFSKHSLISPKKGMIPYNDIKFFMEVLQNEN